MVSRQRGEVMVDQRKDGESQIAIVAVNSRVERSCG